MTFKHRSSFEDYARTYLRRDAAKRAKQLDAVEDPIGLMNRRHRGKVRAWFPTGHFCVVELASVDLEQLVFLSGPETISPGLVPEREWEDCRLLRAVGERAVAARFLDFYKDGGVAKYFGQLLAGRDTFGGEDRLVLCDLNQHERRTNPAGSYYLLDGTARGLALMLIHLLHPERSLPRLEALLITEYAMPCHLASHV